MNQFALKIATNVEQSDRMVALGIKTETADCFIRQITETDDWSDCNTNHSLFEPWMNKDNIIKSMFKPSWSLSRIIEMMPAKIAKNRKVGSLFVSHEDISYFGFESDKRISFITGFTKGPDENLFDICIDMIDWLIKNNHFNKEYLR